MERWTMDDHFKRVDPKLFVAIGEGQVEVAIDDEVVEIVARGERAQLLGRETSRILSIVIRRRASTATSRE